MRRGNLSDDRVAEHVHSADRPERRVGGEGDPVPPREAEGRVVAAVERRALGARRPLAPVRRRVAGDGERVLHQGRHKIATAAARAQQLGQPGKDAPPFLHAEFLFS